MDHFLLFPLFNSDITPTSLYKYSGVLRRLWLCDLAYIFCHLFLHKYYSTIVAGVTPPNTATTRSSAQYVYLRTADLRLPVVPTPSRI